MSQDSDGNSSSSSLPPINGPTDIYTMAVIQSESEGQSEYNEGTNEGTERERGRRQVGREETHQIGTEKNWFQFITVKSLAKEEKFVPLYFIKQTFLSLSPPQCRAAKTISSSLCVRLLAATAALTHFHFFFFIGLLSLRRLAKTFFIALSFC